MPAASPFVRQSVRLSIFSSVFSFVPERYKYVSYCPTRSIIRFTNQRSRLYLAPVSESASTESRIDERIPPVSIREALFSLPALSPVASFSRASTFSASIYLSVAAPDDRREAYYTARSADTSCAKKINTRASTRLNLETNNRLMMSRLKSRFVKVTKQFRKSFRDPYHSLFYPFPSFFLPSRSRLRARYTRWSSAFYIILIHPDSCVSKKEKPFCGHGLLCV